MKWRASFWYPTREAEQVSKILYPCHQKYKDNPVIRLTLLVVEFCFERLCCCFCELELIEFMSLRWAVFVFLCRVHGCWRQPQSIPCSFEKSAAVEVQILKLRWVCFFSHSTFPSFCVIVSVVAVLHAKRLTIFLYNHGTSAFDTLSLSWLLVFLDVPPMWSCEQIVVYSDHVLPPRFCSSNPAWIEQRHYSMLPCPVIAIVIDPYVFKRKTLVFNWRCAIFVTFSKLHNDSITKTHKNSFSKQGQWELNNKCCILPQMAYKPP